MRPDRDACLAGALALSIAASVPLEESCGADEAEMLQGLNDAPVFGQCLYDRLVGGRHQTRDQALVCAEIRLLNLLQALKVLIALRNHTDTMDIKVLSGQGSVSFEGRRQPAGAPAGQSEQTLRRVWETVPMPSMQLVMYGLSRCWAAVRASLTSRSAPRM